MKSKELPKNPVEITLSMLNTKWKPLIIKELLSGTKRFLELKSAVGQITQKVLTSNLRDMEEKGLVERKVYREIPPRVEYTLTDIGYSLATIIEPMEQWGCAYKELLRLIEKQENRLKKG